MAYPVDPDKQKLAQQIQRDIQSGVPIDPELREYAESIMPSLRPQKVLPDNYNSLAQKEALSQQSSQLPNNYNELAQDEANQQNPLPSNYNQLAQEEADEQDTKEAEVKSLSNFSLRDRAIKSLQAKNYASKGNLPPLNLLEREMLRLSEEDDLKQKRLQEKQKRSQEESDATFDKNLEIQLQKKRLGLSEEMDPELREHAKIIFPSLNEMFPKNENEGVQIPFAPKESMKEEVSQDEAVPQQQPKTKSTSQASKKELTTEAIKKESSIQRQPTAKQEQSIDDLIKGIREEQDRVSLSKQSAKLRDAIMGAGIGQIKQTDVNRYEELAKRAERPLTDMLLKDELKDKQAKNDPNSNISMLTRNFLKERGVNMAGLENISYSQIEKLLPTFMNIINTEIAAKAKKEEAAVNRSIKEQLAEEKQYNRTRDIVNSKASKLLDNKNSPLSSYNQAKQASSIIDSAIESWDEQDLDAKIKNSVSFMQYAKIAQGDDSVVRSSDMQALAGSLNLRPTALLSKVFSKVQGQAFTKNELMEMKKVLDIIRKVKKEQIQSRINPIILDAQRGNYDISQSIDSSLLEEIYSKEPMSLDERAKRQEELLRKKAAAEK
jgi:hypothetical protein